MSSAGTTPDGLPDFLIIGGMKCGSTTLFRDLEAHPRIHFPIDKEPATLCHDDVLTEAGTRAYAELFKDAGADQITGEASTDYTKLPDHAGVASRAHALLGDGVRLVYVLRDPIKRLLSHHRHDGDQGLVPANLDEAIERCPGLVEYSRYAAQLEPWLDAFGREAILLVRFEDYVTDRDAQCARVCTHLGVDPIPGLVDAGAVHNASANKPVLKGPWRAVAHSSLYRGTVRKILSRDMRDRIRRLVLPTSDFTPEPPSRAVLERLVETFEADHRALRGLVGADAPAWNLGAHLDTLADAAGGR